MDRSGHVWTDTPRLECGNSLRGGEEPGVEGWTIYCPNGTQSGEGEPDRFLVRDFYTTGG